MAKTKRLRGPHAKLAHAAHNGKAPAAGRPQAGPPFKTHADDPDPMLLRVEQVAKVLGIGKRTVWRLVSGGTLPPPVALGRCKRWKHSDVTRFVEGLKG